MVNAVTSSEKGLGSIPSNSNTRINCCHQTQMANLLAMKKSFTARNKSGIGTKTLHDVGNTKAIYL